MWRPRRIVEEVRAVRPREALGELLHRFDEHDVLTFAAAIAFQVLFALIPLALCGLGILGTLGLQQQWSGEWAPKVRGTMSPDVFRVVDATVRRVLGERQLFWTTTGAAIAVWKVSAATRAIMDVLDRVYGSTRDRSFVQRLRVSLVLGTIVALLLLSAVAAPILGDDVLRAVGVTSPLVLWLRWPVALALLYATVALLVAYAPVDRQEARWVTFGSTVVVVSWAGTSAVLAWYLTSVADYGSVFGALATVVVTLTYLYFACAGFLTGTELDAMVRERVDGRVRGARATPLPA